MVRPIAEPKAELEKVEQFLYKTAVPAPVFPLWDQSSFDPPAEDVEDAIPKVKWGSETENMSTFLLGLQYCLRKTQKMLMVL